MRPAAEYSSHSFPFCLKSHQSDLASKAVVLFWPDSFHAARKHSRLDLHSDALSLLCAEWWRTLRRRLNHRVFHAGAGCTGKRPQAYLESDEITAYNAEEVPNSSAIYSFCTTINNEICWWSYCLWGILLIWTVMVTQVKLTCVTWAQVWISAQRTRCTPP